ncbi:hypothetical protein ACEQ6A_28520 [Rhizobium brockwellii]|uniref:hypothetical protein n=1 Tax=Rhizobium brockwellii TaxID=3019932 RepID=UPI003F9B26A4
MIFARNRSIEFDPPNIDLLERLRGIADQGAPITAGAVMQALVDDAETLGNSSFHELSLILFKACRASRVVKQFKAAEVAQREAVDILEPGLKSTSGGQEPTFELRKNIHTHRPLRLFWKPTQITPRRVTSVQNSSTLDPLIRVIGSGGYVS